MERSSRTLETSGKFRIWLRLERGNFTGSKSPSLNRQPFDPVTARTGGVGKSVTKVRDSAGRTYVRNAGSFRRLVAAERWIRLAKCESVHRHLSGGICGLPGSLRSRFHSVILYRKSLELRRECAVILRLLRLVLWTQSHSFHTGCARNIRRESPAF